MSTPRFIKVPRAAHRFQLRNPKPRARHRRGFSLVELMVALVLIDCGLLILVAASAVVTRELGASSSRSLAISAAVARLERLAATACAASPNAGSATGAGAREWWTATREDASTRSLSDSVAYPTSAGVRTIVLRTRARC